VAHPPLGDWVWRLPTRNRAVDGWVSTILRSTASDSLKMAEAWVKVHRTKILDHAIENVRSQTSHRVWACFEQRLLFDRPGAEVARELGLEVGNVFVNAHRVLERIRAICHEFDEDLIDDDDSGVSGRD
jgi:DNA-directed RNA polymerase specialized sigma24 family protein